MSPAGRSAFFARNFQTYETVVEGVLPPSTGRILETQHQLTPYHSPEHSVVSTAVRMSGLIIIRVFSKIYMK